VEQSFTDSLPKVVWESEATMTHEYMVRHSTPADRAWIENALERNWGGCTIAVHDEAFECLSLPVLVAGDRDGLLIYSLGELAEIVVLESFRRGAGVGTALVNALVSRVRDARLPAIRVTTTNDNVDALRFYQRRGFHLMELRVGAVDRANVLLRFEKEGTVGANCSQTLGLITQSMLQVEGVKNVKIDAKNNGVQVSYDPGKTTPHKIVAAFNKENPDTPLQSSEAK
jgi:DNA-3-methyladenine glycosylase I